MTQPTPGIDREHGLGRLETSIAGQSDAISQAITANFDGIRDAAVLLAGARRVRLCGVGLSATTAQVGEQLLRTIGIDARAAHAFDVATYPTSFDPGDLLLVFAHRGTNAYTARVLQRAIHAGLKTIVIADQPDGMRGAEVRIDTTRGREDDAPAAPFTAALAILAAIAARCEPQSRIATAVASLPELARTMLATRDIATEVASIAIEPARRTLILGAGGNAGAARVGAIWVKTLAHVVCEGMHLEDAIHGGLLALRPDDLLIQLAPAGAADDRQADLVVITNAIGFPRWKLGGKPDGSRWHTPLPETVEALTPILTAIPLQWLALEASRAAGIDLDDTSQTTLYADAFSAIGL
ncbi:MAG: SIS domain-containing protein [Acidobacteriota bacterium]|nr:SIS domain-containing protein [Acidobacteriota bacterium]